MQKWFGDSLTNSSRIFFHDTSSGISQTIIEGTLQRFTPLVVIPSFKKKLLLEVFQKFFHVIFHKFLLKLFHGSTRFCLDFFGHPLEISKIILLGSLPGILSENLIPTEIPSRIVAEISTNILAGIPIQASTGGGNLAETSLEIATEVLSKILQGILSEALAGNSGRQFSREFSRYSSCKFYKDSFINSTTIFFIGISLRYL